MNQNVVFVVEVPKTLNAEPPANELNSPDADEAQETEAVPTAHKTTKAQAAPSGAKKSVFKRINKVWVAVPIDDV